jgi:hypothetical protein
MKIEDLSTMVKTLISDLSSLSNEEYEDATEQIATASYEVINSVPELKELYKTMFKNRSILSDEYIDNILHDMNMDSYQQSAARLFLKDTYSKLMEKFDA